MAVFNDVEVLARLNHQSTAATAFAEVFEAYYKLIRMSAYARLTDLTAADDIAQKVFIAFWEKTPYKKHIIVSFRAFLLTMCKYECMNYLESQRAKRENMNGYNLTVHTQENPTFSESFQIKEMIEIVVNNMPPQRKLAFDLVHLKNFKYAEAAKIMDVGVNTVKLHLRLALDDLRSHLRHLL